MKGLLRQAGLEGVEVASAALHTDEIGSDVHSGTRRVLTRHGVPFTRRRAWLLTAETAHAYDLLIGMDYANLRNMQHFFGEDPKGKLHLLLDYTARPGEVADPWYTGDFTATWNDVNAGCRGLLHTLCPDCLCK